MAVEYEEHMMYPLVSWAKEEEEEEDLEVLPPLCDASVSSSSLSSLLSDNGDDSPNCTSIKLVRNHGNLSDLSTTFVASLCSSSSLISDTSDRLLNAPADAAAATAAVAVEVEAVETVALEASLSAGGTDLMVRDTARMSISPARRGSSMDSNFSAQDNSCKTAEEISAIERVAIAAFSFSRPVFTAESRPSTTGTS